MPALGQTTSGGFPVLTQEEKLVGLVGAGVVVGLVGGKMIVDHVFREGMTSRERRDILLFAAGTLLWYGFDKLYDAEKKMDEWSGAALKELSK